LRAVATKVNRERPRSILRTLHTKPKASRDQQYKKADCSDDRNGVGRSRLDVILRDFRVR
jgi:hypothetical protein